MQGLQNAMDAKTGDMNKGRCACWVYAVWPISAATGSRA